MTSRGFGSVFATHMELYLDDHAARGFSNNCHIKTLRHFDRFVTKRGLSEEIISQEIYDEWFSTMDSLRYTTRYQSAVHLRTFAIFLTKLGIPSFIPRLPKYKRSDYVAYIFSTDEIDKIFDACDKTIIRKRSLTSILMVMPSLLRLLYSTGIRVGEALAIRNRDLNFEKHVITLYYTKNGHERLAPINATLEVVLKQYINYRNKMPVHGIDSPDNYLFVTLQGKQVRENSVLANFKRVLEMSGIIDAYNSKLPRIHDLRHTACVHAMCKMLRQGKDLYCHLPILATFMGHVKITDTEYYLKLVQQQYPELIKQQVSVVESITGIVNRALIIKSEDDV